jgi:hypothetical protein
LITDAERTIVDLMGKRFISHGEKYAEQYSNGAYSPVVGALTRSALADHLRGVRTYGHYLVSKEDDCVKLVAFDLDLRNEPVEIDGHVCECPREAVADPEHPDREVLVLQLRMLAHHLSYRMRDVAAHQKIPLKVGAAFSGSKGIHVYGWFRERRPAGEAINFGRFTLASFKQHGCLEFKTVRGKSTFRNELGFAAVDVEIYPKQKSLEGKTHGNLMRLPLGKNRKTSGDSFFLKPMAFDGDEYQFVPMDALQALEQGTL